MNFKWAICKIYSENGRCW